MRSYIQSIYVYTLYKVYTLLSLQKKRQLMTLPATVRRLCITNVYV